MPSPGLGNHGGRFVEDLNGHDEDFGRSNVSMPLPPLLTSSTLHPNRCAAPLYSRTFLSLPSRPVLQLPIPLFLFLSLSLSVMDHHHRSHLPPPPYMVLGEQGNNSPPLRPPPNRRNLPRYYSHRSSSCCTFRCCCCWCSCFLLLLIIICITVAAYISFIVKPQMPSYSFDKLSIGGLNFDASDLTIRTKLIVAMRARNPNDMIGIRYKDGSLVMVSYRNAPLCSGRLPSFYQGHRNTTVMQVVLEGQHKVGAGIHGALQENQRTGRIPLKVFVRVPVSLRIFNIDWRQVTVNVTCALVVDGLSPNKKVGIRSADYKVDVGL